MLEMTLCEIIDGGRILLKKASKGVSKGKWNGLGGKIEDGESDSECLRREVAEESGLTVKDFEKVGTMMFYIESRQRVFGRAHLFLVKSFGGTLKESDEGELRWFGLDEIPYGEMWNDDIYWLPHLIEGKRFDSEFVFDEKMDVVKEYALRNIR